MLLYFVPKSYRFYLKALIGLFIMMQFTQVASTKADEKPVSSLPQFVDVTLPTAVVFRHVNGATGKKYFPETMGSGAAFLDYDNDGYLDLYVVNGGIMPGFETKVRPRNALYHNNHDGTFTNVTEKANVAGYGYGMGCVCADYDNDGWEDIYVTCFGPNVLYHNNGDGTFTDVSKQAGVDDPRWGTSASFFDYNNDGLLDLYVANYVDYDIKKAETMKLVPYMSNYKEYAQKETRSYPHPDNFGGSSCILYRNNGNGTFTDVTREAGIFNPNGKALGVVVGDYDNDSFPDIFVANDEVPAMLFHNNGNGTFTDVALTAGVAYDEDGNTLAGMGVDFGDYNNDGYLDIISMSFQSEPKVLFRNEGNGLFSDVSFMVGTGLVGLPYVAFGTGFLDYDNDGYLDLFFANGHVMDNIKEFNDTVPYGQKNVLLRNNGPDERKNWTFTDVSSSSGEGLAIEKVSRGVAFGDYDNDGDMDIFIVNSNDTTTFLRNEGGNRNNWLTVRTIGTKSNRDGIGTRIEAKVGSLVEIREIKAGSSYMSQNDMRVTFGLGNRDKVDSLQIRWPSGTIEQFKDIKSRQFITVKEGQGIIDSRGGF